MRTLVCKGYHGLRARREAGRVRGKGTRKSKCPPWLGNAAVRQRLLDEALVDPGGAKDVFGEPKRVWNAVAGWYFVGVATNAAQGDYNCYPDVPVTSLHQQLSERANRTLEDFLAAGAKV